MEILVLCADLFRWFGQSNIDYVGSNLKPIMAQALPKFLIAFFNLFFLISLKKKGLIITLMPTFLKINTRGNNLICDISGGVGWAATQLAKLFSNVTILGTASESKFKMVVENGVNRPLTYENYATIISQSEGEVDCIIDSIGGSNFAISQKLLKPLGHAVLTGT